MHMCGCQGDETACRACRFSFMGPVQGMPTRVPVRRPGQRRRQNDVSLTVLCMDNEHVVKRIIPCLDVKDGVVVRACSFATTR